MTGFKTGGVFFVFRWWMGFFSASWEEMYPGFPNDEHISEVSGWAKLYDYTADQRKAQKKNTWGAP